MFSDDHLVLISLVEIVIFVHLCTVLTYMYFNIVGEGLVHSIVM